MRQGREKENKAIIDVEGFEVEYRATDRTIAECNDIGNKLEESDEWIGSGMPRPAKFLEDNKVVVFHFEYLAVCEDLKHTDRQKRRRSDYKRKIACLVAK